MSTTKGAQVLLKDVLPEKKKESHFNENDKIILNNKEGLHFRTFIHFTCTGQICKTASPLQALQLPLASGFTGARARPRTHTTQR